jgi:hypothetical protein
MPLSRVVTPTGPARFDLRCYPRGGPVTHVVAIEDHTNDGMSVVNAVEHLRQHVLSSLEPTRLPLEEPVWIIVSANGYADPLEPAEYAEWQRSRRGFRSLTRADAITATGDATLPERRTITQGGIVL